MPPFLKTVFRLLTPLVFSTALLAQFDTAEVLGTVKDPGGNAIPKANVTLLKGFES